MDFLTEWGRIAGIAGMALGLFLVLFREVIRKNIFPKLTGKQAFIIIILFMLLVFSISVYTIVQFHSGRSGVSAQVTVLVHGEKGRDHLVLPGRGRVKLLFGDANIVETTNDKGEATFKQIPKEFFDSKATVEIHFLDPEGEPYYAENPDSLYRLTHGKYIALPVKLYGIGSIRGIVKDFNTGRPVEGVRISIRGIGAFSDSYGEYTLEIPPEHQRKFQSVRAFKEGYEHFELTNVPVQTENELPILIKPIK